MILCDTGANDATALDDLVVFVSQARAAGLPVAIHRRSLSDELSETTRYDLAPFKTEVRVEEADSLILLGAEQVTDDRLRHLRALTGGKPIECLAYGRFETQQQRIGSAARLSYALGAEPAIYDAPGIQGLPRCIAPVFSTPTPATGKRKPTLAIFFPDVEDTRNVTGIRSLSLVRGYDIVVISQGKNKSHWISALNHEIPVWHPGEILPRAMASRIDVAILCERPMGWYRFQSILANLVGKGAILIDGSEQRHWANLPEGIIPGTNDFQALYSWLRDEINPVLNSLKSEVAKSELTKHISIPKELHSLKSPSNLMAGSRCSDSETRHIVFMPTNGVGLGHAKRCSLIASSLNQPDRAVFAAFPSCLQMLTKSGFDAMPLVSRNMNHGGNDNDLINHARITVLSRNAAGLVFDGGYVFDSVLRSIADNAIPSVWIRRGLWQSSQNNGPSLDRQKIFDQIVVPQEAFEELNDAAPRKEKVVEVGPLVHRIDHSDQQRTQLRAAIQRRIGREVCTLVVTMLGGGVAADRRAQINAIGAHFAAKKDVLNLLVVWPTAVVDPAWFAHQNTVVVQSSHASALITAADLFISAVGYNSFHEALYGAVPTIFVPQMASFMDDQRARARAAAERDIALLVEPWEALGLSHAIDECLEGRAVELRNRLRQVNLPEPGLRAAARVVEEVCQ